MSTPSLPLPVRLHLLASRALPPVDDGPAPEGQGDLSPRFGKEHLAAQYLRVSTDLQECSLGMQRECIAAYAQRHGLVIVRTFTDEARSGLWADRRPGLCSLVHEVAQGSAPYSVILVHDVSRWGRFQDCDEAAFYEFLCRKMGIQVRYCGEPFANDQSGASEVLKVIKRLMAAEYSRELSVKVASSKLGLSRQGFRQGGSAGFGYRRMLVRADGTGLTLETGQHKFHGADRVILVPGPAPERSAVRWIFRQMALGRCANAVARELNQREVVRAGGRRWSGENVYLVVRNPKYIGQHVFNLGSRGLGQRHVWNPEEQVVRIQGVHAALVSPALFERARVAMEARRHGISDEEALSALRALVARHGRLTAALVNRDKGGPHQSVYRRRFGGLLRAYALIGYTPKRDLSHAARRGARLAEARAFREEVGKILISRGVEHRWAGPELTTGAGVRLAVTIGLLRPGPPPRWKIQVQVPAPLPPILAQLRSPDDRARYLLIRRGGNNSEFQLSMAGTRGRSLASRPEPLLDILLGSPGERHERPDAARRPGRVRGSTA